MRTLADVSIDPDWEGTFDTLRRRVNDNAALVRRGRWMTADFVVGVDDQDFVISIREGRVTGIERRGLQTVSGVFAIRASGATWRKHWLAVPPRDYHDLWSMLPKGYARLDGDLLPLMQNLQFVKDVLASPRERIGGSDDA